MGDFWKNFGLLLAKSFLLQKSERFFLREIFRVCLDFAKKAMVDNAKMMEARNKRIDFSIFRIGINEARLKSVRLEFMG